MIRGITTIAIPLLLAGTSLSAQMPERHPHDADDAPAMPGQRMMMDGMMGRGMMGSAMMEMMGQGMGMMVTGGAGPAVILRMSEAVELTESQIVELEGIRSKLATARERHMDAAMSYHEAARGALQGDSPDFDAYENALEAMSAEMIQAHLVIARAAVEARGLLTERQRELLEEGVRMMEGMTRRSGAGARHP